MDIAVKIATAIVVASGIGVGGYFVVSNDVSVEVNVAPQQAALPMPSGDFRDRIPGYDELDLKEKIREIGFIYDALEGEEKIQAAKERSKLNEAYNDHIWRDVGKTKSEGYVPKGWEN